MGAGTERSQLAALADFTRYGDAVRALAENSTAMLFAGTAMELLGKTITDASGRSTPASHWQTLLRCRNAAHPGRRLRQDRHLPPRQW